MNNYNTHNRAGHTIIQRPTCVSLFIWSLVGPQHTISGPQTPRGLLGLAVPHHTYLVFAYDGKSIIFGSFGISWYLGPWNNHHNKLNNKLRATSHTKLRARDQCTSRTLVGGKGGARSKLTSHYA